MKIVIPLLAAALAAGCGNGKVAQEPVRPVLTQTVVPGAAATRDVYSGEVRARHEADVDSASAARSSPATSTRARAWLAGPSSRGSIPRMPSSPRAPRPGR